MFRKILGCERSCVGVNSGGRMVEVYGEGKGVGEWKY